MLAVSSVLSSHLTAAATDIAIVAAALLCILFRVIQFNRVIRWWHDRERGGGGEAGEGGRGGRFDSFREDPLSSSQNASPKSKGNKIGVNVFSASVLTRRVRRGNENDDANRKKRRKRRMRRKGRGRGEEGESREERASRGKRDVSGSGTGRRVLRGGTQGVEEYTTILEQQQQQHVQSHSNLLQHSFSFVASFAKEEPPPVSPTTVAYLSATPLSSPGRSHGGVDSERKRDEEERRGRRGERGKGEDSATRSMNSMRGGPMCVAPPSTSSPRSLEYLGHSGSGENVDSHGARFTAADPLHESKGIPSYSSSSFPPQWEKEFHVSRRNELIFAELPLNTRIQAAVNWLSVISNCLTDFLRPSQVLYIFLFSSCDFMLYTLTPEEEEEEEEENEEDGDRSSSSSSRSTDTNNSSYSSDSTSISDRNRSDSDTEDTGDSDNDDDGSRAEPKASESVILIGDPLLLASPTGHVSTTHHEDGREIGGGEDRHIIHEFEHEASKSVPLYSLRRIQYVKHRCTFALSSAFSYLRSELLRKKGGGGGGDASKVSGNGSSSSSGVPSASVRGTILPRWLQWSRVQLALRQIIRSTWCVRVFPFSILKASKKTKGSDVEDGGESAVQNNYTEEEEEEDHGDVCLNLESEGTAWLLVNSVLLFTLLIFHLHGLFFVVGQACGYIASLGTLYVLGREVGGLMDDLQEYAAHFHRSGSNFGSGSKCKKLRSYVSHVFFVLLCPPWLLNRVSPTLLGKVIRAACGALRTMYRFLGSRLRGGRRKTKPTESKNEEGIVRKEVNEEEMKRDSVAPTLLDSHNHCFPLSSAPPPPPPLSVATLPPYQPPELPIAVLTNAALARYYTFERIFSILCSIIYAVMLLDEGEALYNTHIEFMRWYANTIGLALVDTVQLLRFLVWKRAMRQMNAKNGSHFGDDDDGCRIDV